MFLLQVIIYTTFLFFFFCFMLVPLYKGPVVGEVALSPASFCFQSYQFIWRIILLFFFRLGAIFILLGGFYY